MASAPYLPAHAAAVVAVFLLSACSKSDRVARHLERAEAHRAASDYNSAEIEFLNALKLDAANPAAIQHLGIIYQEQVRLSRAFPFLQKAIEIAPEDPDLRARLGLVYLAAGDLVAARETSLAVLEIKADHADSLLLLAETSVRPEDIRDARDRIQHAGSDPASPAALAALATLAHHEGQTDQARQLLESAVRAAPDFAPALSALGNVLAVQGRRKEAGDYLARASAASPPRAPARLRYPQFLLESGDTAGARTLLEGIVQETADLIPAWTLLAEIALTERRLEDAKAIVVRTLARDPFIPEALLLDGRLKLEEQKPDEAIAALEKMQRLYPQAAQVPYALAAARVAKGDASRAIAQLHQSLRLAPGFDGAAVMLATLYLQRGDPAAALLAIRPVASRRPEFVPAQFALAEALRGVRRFDEALAVYERLDGASPQGAQLPYLMGLVQVQASDSVRAAAAFDEALRRDPDSLPALEQRVNLDLAAKDFPTAMNRVIRERERRPEIIGLDLIEATVHLAQSHNDEVEICLLRAIERQPDGRMPYLMLARLYLDTGQRQAAIERLTQVTARDAGDVGAWTMLGILHDEDGRFEEARQAYEAVIRVNGRAGVALNNLAYLYTEHYDKHDDALALAKRAREVMPNEPHVAGTLGWTLFKKGEFSWAHSLLQESASKLPDLPVVAYHLGMASYALGKEHSAQQAFESALGGHDDFPGREEIQPLLDFLLLGNSADRNAVSARLAVDSSDPIALLRLADLDRQAGDTTRAIDLCQRVLAKCQDNTRALNLLGWSQMEVGAHADALATARRLYKLALEQPGSAHLMGRAAYLSGDHEWAVALLREAARAEAGNANVFRCLGDAELAIGALPEAREAFRRGLALTEDPVKRAFDEDTVGLIEIAQSPEGNAGELDHAKALVQREPDHLAALAALARLEGAFGSPGAARHIHERIVQRFPSFAPSLAALARHALVEGALVRAQEYASRARERLQDDPGNNRTLGILACKRGDFRSALALLDRAAAAFPNDAELLFFSGVAQGETGNTSIAAATLHRALAAGLSGTQAEEARERLGRL